MKSTRLGDLCSIRSGGTPSRSIQAYYGGSIPWAKISDIEACDGRIDETEETITEAGLAAIRGRIFTEGTLLFAIYGSIGKIAFCGRSIAANQAILGIEFPANNSIEPRYLYRYLESRRDALMSDGVGITQKNLSAGYIRDLKIPLPPIAEQRRIARVLDQADALRRLRRQSLSRLSDFGQAIFREMFGDVRINDRNWDDGVTLQECAEVVSGITKGRKLNGQFTRAIPYMTVATVQDGYLNLNNVKSIDATDREIERYRLLPCDILLTEGGDPDKLGRGAMWLEQLPECIHQNHVFRVRVRDNRITPTFATWLIGSSRGKSYFFRAAKQTTGIASISSTQLKMFPLILPPIELQNEFTERLSLLDMKGKLVDAAIEQTDSLFASLQHHAFRGEL